jgi:flagellum-specific peptidoglycan hydrolase FlgJ
MSTEVFNPSKVKTVMSDIASEFDALSKLIETTNTLVTTALGSPDKAVYGDAGNKILATWDENCSTLSSFIKIYDNWSLMAVSIAREYGELDKGTARVKDADAEALKTVADTNRTTWLKTLEGSKGYVGSTNSYINAQSGTRVTEKSDLKNMRVVDRGNGLTEYYSLDGKLLGIKRNGQYYDANGRKIDSKDLRYKAISDDELKKAQTTLKGNIDAKHKELAKRDKERTEIPKYKNPGHLSGYQLEFIEKILKGAVQAYKKYGIPVSLTLAQGILESGWGQSTLTAKYNNAFGVKEGSDWNGKTVRLKTGEQNKDGSRYTIYANFRVYDNINDSVVDHAKVLLQPRYRALFSAKNFEDVCYAVKAGGYATSVNYAKNLINLIKRYGLDQWDKYTA